MNKRTTIIRFFSIAVASVLLQGLFLQSGSHAKRLVTVANNPNLSMVSGETSAAVLAPPSLPDITSTQGITIGGAIGGAGGHFSAWGGTITLSASDAIVNAGGKCAFNVSYDMRNLGTTATSVPFKNKLRIGSTDVSIQSSLSLAGGATKQINTQAYLNSGTNTLSLFLDSDNVVSESNEGNNARKVSIKVSCAGLPDIVSQKGITIGGAAGGVGGHFSAWGGSITLSAADASIVTAGQCAFNISYDVENTGPSPTSPLFLNRLRNDSTVVSTQIGIAGGWSIPAGGAKQIETSPYLAHGDHVLSLWLDDDHVVNESNEANNTYKVKIKVNCP